MKTKFLLHVVTAKLESCREMLYLAGVRLHYLLSMLGQSAMADNLLLAGVSTFGFK
jgi:hypothetical protein